MPVLQQNPVINYTANGSVTSFAYPYQVLSLSDLKVYVNGAQVTSGFTVSGIGNASGGNVTFTVAPANGYPVRLVRTTNISRTTDYVEGGYIQADTLDADIDRSVMMTQELDALALKESTDGKFDAEGKVIKNVADPVNANDAVNKQYYDGTVVPNLNAIISAGQAVMNSSISAGQTAMDNSISAGQTAINATLASATAQANSATSSASASANSATASATSAAEAAQSASSAATSAATATTQATASATSASQAAYSATVAASYSNGVLGGINTWTGTNTYNNPIALSPTGSTVGTAVQLYGNSDNANSTVAAINLLSTELQISSGRTGTAGYVPLTFYTGGAEKMRIDNAGNVGFGTVPQYGIHMKQSQSSANSWITAQNATGAGSFGAGFLAFQGTASNFAYFKQGADGKTSIVNNAATGPITFTTGGTESMRIDSAGRVGIGITTPSWAVDVAGSSPGVRVRDSGSTNGAVFQQVTGGNTYLNLQDSAALIFNTNNTEKMRIEADGKVGIGGIPTSELYVKTATGACKAMLTNNSTSFVAGVSSAGNLGVIGMVTNHDLMLYAGTSERVRIDTAGKVGIGVTTPGYPLHVRADNAAASTWVTSQNGTAGAGYGAGFLALSGTDGLNYSMFSQNSTGNTVVMNATATGSLILGTNNTGWVTIGAAGQLGVGGANYGTAGQFLTSGGPSAAPTWTSGSFMPKDFAAGSFPIGCIIYGVPYNVNSSTNVTHTAGSAYSGSVVSMDSDRAASVYQGPGAKVNVGTWRVIGRTGVCSLGAGTVDSCIYTMYQRIA